MPETALRGTHFRDGFIPYLCYVRSYVRGHHRCCLSFLQHAEGTQHAIISSVVGVGCWLWSEVNKPWWELSHEAEEAL